MLRNIKKPYNITYRTYKKKNGVQVKRFIYTITDASGIPEDFLENRKVCKYPDGRFVKSRREAEAYVLSRIDELKEEVAKRKGRWYTGIPTLEEFFEPFFIPGKCPHSASYEASTGRQISIDHMYHSRKTFEKHFLRETVDPLMHMSLSEITKSDVIDCQSRLTSRLGRSGAAVSAMKVLKTVLREAYFRELMPTDPTAGIGKVRNEKKVRGVFSLNEIREIFPGDNLGPWESRLAYTMFFLVYCTGLRRRELLALRWEHVQEDHIRVVEAFKGDISAGIIEKPKWDKLRITPLPKKAWESLQEWKKKTKYSSDEDFVFARQIPCKGISAGSALNESRWKNMFKYAMDKSGIDSKGRNLVPHSLRHSIATHLADSGYNLAKIREALGWNSVDVQNVYTHYSEMDLSGQAKQVDGFFEAAN